MSREDIRNIRTSETLMNKGYFFRMFETGTSGDIQSAHSAGTYYFWYYLTSKHAGRTSGTSGRESKSLNNYRSTVSSTD
jgi:hypothetical protein